MNPCIAELVKLGDGVGGIRVDSNRRVEIREKMEALLNRSKVKTMDKHINLDQLEKRIKAMGRPTPFQVIDLIAQMYKELKEPFIPNSLDHVNW